MIILQPYLFWKGHYKKYFENLVSDKYHYIYCDEQKKDFPNALYLKASIYDVEHSFIGFVVSRLLNSFKVSWELIKMSFKKSEERLSLHFIELEPFSFLFFEFFHKGKNTSAVITIHSIEKTEFESNLKNFVSLIQRYVYRIALSRAVKKNYIFVVHYNTHRKQLLNVLNNYSLVVVNEYPAPELKRTVPKELTQVRELLIYGQIREDKGIYEFLNHPEIQKLKITIAGKIHDQRIFALQNVKNYTFLDKFISNEELTEVIDRHSFLVLPYKGTYTGGAGPLKDAFAFGLPVIGSDIDIFHEILSNPRKGFIFKKETDIHEMLSSISSEQYQQMSMNCLLYAKEITWQRMRESYFRLYEQIK